MFYYVIRRPPNNYTHDTNKSAKYTTSTSVLQIMPRYQYARVAPHSATTSSESFFQRQNPGGQPLKPMTPSAMTTTSNNNHSHGSSGLFKSTFVPLVTNPRTTTTSKRELVNIPVTREDGASAVNNSIHSVPITFVSETTTLPTNSTDNNRSTSAKSHYSNLLRPSSKYSQYYYSNCGDESETAVPRLPSVSRRFNLTIPVVATATTTPITITTDDEEENANKQNVAQPSARRIPIRFLQTPNAASIPTNSARISSAVLRSSPIANPSSNQLQRQKADLIDTSLPSDSNGVTANSSANRRAEVMAREAIQGIVRFQQQLPNNPVTDNNNTNPNNIFIRSPALSRRVIVNLKNNQSVSLDSRLLSAHASLARVPAGLSSSRVIQRNNLFHIPILHEIQMPSHPTTLLAETSLHLSQSPSTSNSNNNNFKNEFHMEIPVTVISKDDQENHLRIDNGGDDGIINYDPETTIVAERIPSTNVNSNQALKSILKRSTSRETVSRKNTYTSMHRHSMAMSRRKQLHPKSLKECDETMFLLPDELKCDEESHDITARVDIEQGHRFGPFAATEIACRQKQSDSDSTNISCMTIQIDNETPEDRTQSFQLLDNKHNWLAQCSTAIDSPVNVDITFQNDQLHATLNQPIKIGTRLCSNATILPKLTHSEDVQVKQESKSNMNKQTTDTIEVKEEPIESEEEEQQQQQADGSSPSIMSESSLMNTSIPTRMKEMKKHFPPAFTCDACGIRFSNRSTLDAHREHYCTKRETTKTLSTDSTMTVKIKGMKRKHMDINDSSLSPAKRLLSLNDAYCSECDILFTKPDSLLQHKLHYCGTKPTSLSPSARPINDNLTNSFRPPIPFDRPIQIGQFIYVPVPIVTSQVENNDHSSSPDSHNRPLDLSKPKQHTDETESQRTPSANLSPSPLDLTIDKPSNLFTILNSSSTSPSTTKAVHFVQQQIYECDYCSIRFSSLKTLNAHQENYCIEYRKQKKVGNNNSSTNASINDTKTLTVDSNRSQSPPIASTISKPASSSPNDALSSSYLPPHRSSPFMCRLCKYRGNTLRGMRMHFKFHLSNNEPCSDEDIIITSTTNNPLPVPSIQLLLKCTICSAMFDQEDALLNHIKCVHTKENLLECLECHSRFCSKWNLLRHMKLTHTNIKCDDEPEDDTDVHAISNDSQIKVNETNSEQNIDEDRTRSSSNGKSSDPVNLTRNVLIESMDTNSMKKISDGCLIKKKFACPYCHIKFGSVDTLKQHMMNYCSSRPSNDEQPSSRKKANETYCSTCQIPFRQKSSYEAHKMYYCRGNNKAHVKIQA